MVELADNPGSELILKSAQLGSCDVSLIPNINSIPEIKLVISDMDSTFINIECVDEIADFVGKKQQVSEITEAAMRGELDFKQSLTKRVGLLGGIDETALNEIYLNRLRLNPGAEQMLKGLADRKVKFALVSGGFTFFTSRLKEKYALDFAKANELEIINGKLTGRVLGDIVDGEAKRNYLLQLCQELEITPKQAIAVGDGANDLLMMKESGVGVAYRAKPKVQEQVSSRLNIADLSAILDIVDVLS